MFTEIKKNESCYYLYDIKQKDELVLYQTVKERFNLKMDNRQLFIYETAKIVNQFLLYNKYDCILYPQSSSNFIESIANLCDIKSILIKKNSINNILKSMENFRLQKMEKASHLERISNMGDVFKINSLKANQRIRYEDVLFEKIDIKAKKPILLDDSLFSGTTLRALSKATGVFEKLVIFAK